MSAVTWCQAWVPCDWLGGTSVWHPAPLGALWELSSVSVSFLPHAHSMLTASVLRSERVSHLTRLRSYCDFMLRAGEGMAGCYLP